MVQGEKEDPSLDWTTCSDQELANEMKLVKTKKRDLEKRLLEMETKIYHMETSYFEGTHHGNLVRGWDGYLSRSGGIQKKGRVKDSDRIFTLSSVGALEAIELGETRPHRR